MEENRYHTNDEFEQFLKSETDNNAMYPSDHIWENIRVELHGNRSWPALTFIALFVITSLTISTFFNYPPKAIIEKELAALAPQVQENTVNNNLVTQSTETIDDQLNPNTYTQKTIDAINNDNNVSSVAITKNDIIISSNNVEDVVKQTVPSGLLSSTPFASMNFNITKLNAPIDYVSNNSGNTSDAENASTSAEAVNKKLRSIKNYPAGTLFKDDDPNADAFLKDFTVEKNKITAPGKFSIQYFITPSVSYRKLVDDKQRSSYINLFAATSQQNPTVNINDAVRHTPALGFEAGLNVLYNITKNLKIKTGFQFNVRQYFIDAYQSNSSVATIAFVQNNHLDSINMASMCSNTGYYSTKLDNKLYQVSIPIGLQWDFIQGKQFGLSAGASFQPTFTLNKNIYAISTDYKYYANGAPFLRKWNWNSSVDLSFTYQTKNAKWYIGPQFRYQHLPTYNDVYPIKEYRWDYGLKIGIIKPLSSK